jgi:hypothetical protein
MPTTEATESLADRLWRTGTKELSREEKLEVFVNLSALDAFLTNIAELEVFEGVLSWDEFQVCLNRGESVSDIAADLWPEDGTGEDVPREDRPEYVLVDARVETIVSQMFTMLSEDREAFLERARHFAGLAIRKIQVSERHLRAEGDDGDK